MSLNAPISCHLDLYRYWDTKRGSQSMPSREDIDPIDIPRLIPFIALIEADHGRYRWRLVGTGIVADIGRDLTGQTFGSYVTPPSFVAAMEATFHRVLRDSQPVFEEHVYKTAFYTSRTVSRIILPLAAGNRSPPMILFTRITRYIQTGPELTALDVTSGQVMATHDVSSLAELERYAMAWERAAEFALPKKIPPKGIVRVAGLWDGGAPRLIP